MKRIETKFGIFTIDNGKNRAPWEGPRRFVVDNAIMPSNVSATIFDPIYWATVGNAQFERDTLYGEIFQDITSRFPDKGIEYKEHIITNLSTPTDAPGTGTQVTVPIIASDIEPNVSANPKLKNYAWLDISTDPPTFKSYFDAESRWVDCCFGKGGSAMTTLPSVTFSPMTGSAPLTLTLAVPGFPGAIIRYTRGSAPADPDATSPIYTGALAVSGAETIKAYATYAAA